MMNGNRVFLMGALTADPVIKKTVNDHDVCRFRLACSLKRFKNEEVLFIDVHAWDEVAQSCDMLAKGSRVVLEGYLRNIKWTDKEGKDHWKHIILAESVTVQ
ncbi:MAG: single-stranded DNA-binding protein [Chlamydiota bacterium]|nr:single-stranded DNA-binding protein [Chlamydiota bacterium]